MSVNSWGPIGPQVGNECKTVGVLLDPRLAMSVKQLGSNWTPGWQ